MKQKPIRIYIIMIIFMFFNLFTANADPPCVSKRSYFGHMGFNVSYGLFTLMLDNATILRCSPKDRSDLRNIYSSSRNLILPPADTALFKPIKKNPNLKKVKKDIPDSITLTIDTIVIGNYKDSTITLFGGYYSNIDNKIYVFINPADSIHHTIHFFPIGDTTFYEGYHVSIEQAIRIGLSVINNIEIENLSYCDSIMLKYFKSINKEEIKNKGK